MFILRESISVVYPQCLCFAGSIGRKAARLWITVLKIRNKAVISQVFRTVIHRHNDGRETAADWRKYAVSAIMKPVKGVPPWQSDTQKKN